MSDEDFLRRWSRLKRETLKGQSPKESANALTPKSAETPAPQLPSIDSLNFDSDFKAFMHSKVEENVKRAALKKLFSDPRFNVMDGLDTYIDDYTKAEPISEDLLAKLDHARQTLFGEREEKAEQGEQKPQEPAADAEKRDDDSRKDA